MRLTKWPVARRFMKGSFFQYVLESNSIPLLDGWTHVVLTGRVWIVNSDHRRDKKRWKVPWEVKNDEESLLSLVIDAFVPSSVVPDMLRRRDRGMSWPDGRSNFKLWKKTLEALTFDNNLLDVQCGPQTSPNCENRLIYAPRYLSLCSLPTIVTLKTEWVSLNSNLDDGFPQSKLADPMKVFGCTA